LLFPPSKWLSTKMAADSDDPQGGLAVNSGKPFAVVFP
jgi:hypothetical protein